MMGLHPRKCELCGEMFLSKPSQRNRGRGIWQCEACRKNQEIGTDTIDQATFRNNTGFWNGSLLRSLNTKGRRR